MFKQNPCRWPTLHLPAKGNSNITRHLMTTKLTFRDRISWGMGGNSHTAPQVLFPGGMHGSHTSKTSEKVLPLPTVSFVLMGKSYASAGSYDLGRLIRSVYTAWRGLLEHSVGEAEGVGRMCLRRHGLTTRATHIARCQRKGAGERGRTDEFRSR